MPINLGLGPWNAITQLVDYPEQVSFVVRAQPERAGFNTLILERYILPIPYANELVRTSECLRYAELCLWASSIRHVDTERCTFALQLGQHIHT